MGRPRRSRQSRRASRWGDEGRRGRRQDCSAAQRAMARSTRSTTNATHQACPLSEGYLEGEVLECGCHGSTYNVKTGEVLQGPAQEGVPIASCPDRWR